LHDTTGTRLRSLHRHRQLGVARLGTVKERD
jgi:hypothetical protein